MPLFYFRPFHFHPYQRKTRPPLLEMEPAELITSLAIGLVSLALFVAFVIIPAVVFLRQTGALDFLPF